AARNRAQVQSPSGCPVVMQSGRGRGRPAPSHTTGHAGHASGGSPGMPEPLPSRAESVQTEVLPVLVGQGARKEGAGHPPVPFAASAPLPGLPLGKAEHPEVVSPGLGLLPLLPTHLTEPAAEPFIEVLELLWRLGQREVSAPAADVPVQALDSLCHGYPVAPSGQTPN